MKKVLILGLVLAILAILAVPMAALAGGTPTVYVYNLQPSYTAAGGGGVWSAYYAPDADHSSGVSPGTTAVYDGREAGIIKAGLTSESDGSYSDEGLFAFKPTVTIDDLAAGTLSYDVENQYGENSVWITIEIDTGETGNRTDNTAYQYVPTNSAGWHTVDAAAGQWQQWTNYLSGETTGSLMTLSQVAVANHGLNVVRVYLRLGQGDTYHGLAGLGTVAWVDKVTIGTLTYDFVVNPATQITGTVVGPTVTVTAPAPITFSPFNLGTNYASGVGYVAFGPGSGTYAGWQLTAQDNSNYGYMNDGTNNLDLADPLLISLGGAYTQANYGGISTTGGSSGYYTLYAQQTLVTGDAGGIYSITITLTGSPVL